MQHERRRQLLRQLRRGELRDTEEGTRARLCFRNAIGSMRRHQLAYREPIQRKKKRRRPAAGNQSPINLEIANPGRLAA